MAKSFTKLIFRQITFNKARFLSIFIIVTLGIAVFAGLRATSPFMRLTANDYFEKQAMMDIELLSTTGFSNDELNAIQNIENVNEMMPSYQLEAFVKVEHNTFTVKLHSLNENEQINKIELVKGTYPKSDTECVVDQKFIDQTGKKIGDTIDFGNLPALKGNQYKISGVIKSPLYISIERGLSSLGNGEINSFIYIKDSQFALPLPNDLFLTIHHAKDLSRYSSTYEQKVNDVVVEINQINPNYYHTTLYDNLGFISYQDDTLRIARVSDVFPLIFFLVTVLVSLTSMTRMVENDRTEIGTLKSLGYGRFSITRKYLTYAISASLLGSLVGLVIGYNLFPRIIFDAYGILYDLPKLQMINMWTLSITSTICAVLLVSIPAYLTSISSFIATPATLMRPKAPKPGKRIFLEHLSFIWKRLKFIQKVTARNLLRYKKRFLMTVVGIAGCTALLFTGFGLRDSIGSIIDKQFGSIRTYDMEIYLKDHLATSDYESLKLSLDQNSSIKSYFMIHQQAVTISTSQTSKDCYLIIPQSDGSMRPFINLHNRINQKPISLNDDSVVISEKLASLLHIKKGESIELENNTHDKVNVTVSNIAENYVYHYVYMTPTLYQKLFNQSVSPNEVLTKLNTTQEKVLSEQLMNQNQILSVNLISHLKAHFNDMIETLNEVVWVLIVSAAILAFLVLFTLTNINIDERKRELATIKVLGFYDKEVSSYIDRENMILTIIGILLGLVFGIYLHKFLIVTTETDIVMFSRDVFLSSYLYAGLLTLFFAMMVNLLVYLRIRKIDMIESLKNVE